MKAQVAFMTLIAGVCLCAQPPKAAEITLAGVKLQIGMARETALAALAVAPGTRLQEIRLDFYEVLTHGTDGWVGTGDVIFRDGKLNRICTYATDARATASSIVAALYTAIESKNGEMPLRVWAGVNPDPDPPMREVHLVFVDREVVISSLHPGRNDGASVQVYFPRVLTKP